MNTAQLKRFAQAARRKLMEQVGAKLDFVLSSDSPELREKYRQTEELRKELQRTGKAEVIEKVAYTWFNRLVALRYMDVNDYQPSGIRVITPANGYTQPQAITEAKQGNIPEEWRLDREKVFNLLDGRIPASNPQNEAFRMMLVAACNHLNTVFPFLFEKIDDYSELLLPDDLTSPFSILHDVTEGMAAEDCQAIEVIGWLYQFYISERKDEVFASKSKVSKEDIPAATQLFTPRWIVEYMVQNTVGRLWLLNRPNSRLKEHMTYYIDPVEPVTDYLKIVVPTEMTLLDQACGSGHILVYGFDLLSKIYEEEGYSPSEIPSLIIENNLKGFEIDTRAAQLAGFALMMKAREYNRRAFRKNLKPDITCFRDFELAKEETGRLLRLAGINPSAELLSDLDMIRNATNLGSLIQPRTSLDILEECYRKANTANQVAGIFEMEAYQQISEALGQLIRLSHKVSCVVDNPPYMGGGNMNKELSDFVKDRYPDSKADLMACFMECGLAALKPKGYLGMINQHSWMFLGSYEKLRQKLILEVQIDTLLHLGPRTFPEIGGEVVQNAAFTIANFKPNAKGSFVRLVDYGSSEEKRQKTNEAITNPSCGWYYSAYQKDFEKIPSKTVGYWLSKQSLNCFIAHDILGNYSSPSAGLQTGDNIRFLRYFFEVSYKNIGKNKRFARYNKAGGNTKWYGLNEHVILWENDGRELKATGKSVFRNSDKYFKECISWSLISTENLSARYYEDEYAFDNGAPSLVLKDHTYIFLGLLNSKVAQHFLNVINPTLNFQVGNISGIPICFKEEDKLGELVLKAVQIAKDDWDAHETSMNFKSHSFCKNIMISNGEATISNSYYSLKMKQFNQFTLCHKLEEDINNVLIDSYALREELTPDIRLENITILQQELDRDALAQLNQKLKRDPNTYKVLNYDEIELPFDAREIMAQFVSYSVGCMFGRYSLDKPGLILANQGETLEDYLSIVGGGSFTSEEGDRPLSFLPDEDNVIPVLDDDWFEDDITGRFKKFLKASFGEEHFKENLDFIEECLGRDIRTWFVRDFYPDHVRRYKKRPIYWMFSSPRGNFNALIYMHRYTSDTVSHILNGYLRQLQDKLRMRKQHLQHVQVSGTNTERTQALRESERIEQVLMELHGYERDILYPLAAERVSIDLDDGVLVNYNRFGRAVKEITGLNDAATKKKVKAFDWVDTSNIK